MTTTVVQKWGNSHGIRIPKNLLDALNWKNSDELILKADEGKIIIEKAKPRKNIKELFAGYEGEYKPTEYDFGEPVGEEVW